MDRSRKQQILAAENAERLKRALAAKGVYVLGKLGQHGLRPGEPLDFRGVEAAGGLNMTDQTTPHAKRDADPATPHAVRAPRESGKPDQLKDHAAEAEDRQEALIDEGIEETFPASDPVSAKHIT